MGAVQRFALSRVVCCNQLHSICKKTSSLDLHDELDAALISSVGAVGVVEEQSIIVEAAQNLYENPASFGLYIGSLARLRYRVFEKGPQASFAMACRGYFDSRQKFDESHEVRAFPPAEVLKVLISLLL